VLKIGDLEITMDLTIITDLSSVISWFGRIFWVIAIVITILNAYIYKLRFAKIIEQKPELRDGYNKLVRGYVFYLNIPWVVMGIGMVLGGVSNVFDYFRPSNGNTFVLAFYISILSLWVLGLIWIWFQAGAEFIIKYPGILRKEIKTPKQIRFLSIIIFLGSIFVFINFWKLGW
jgi:hypothetical protein